MGPEHVLSWYIKICGRAGPEAASASPVLALSVNSSPTHYIPFVVSSHFSPWQTLHASMLDYYDGRYPLNSALRPSPRAVVFQSRLFSISFEVTTASQTHTFSSRFPPRLHAVFVYKPKSNLNYTPILQASPSLWQLWRPPPPVLAMEAFCNPPRPLPFLRPSLQLNPFLMKRSTRRS